MIRLFKILAVLFAVFTFFNWVIYVFFDKSDSKAFYISGNKISSNIYFGDNTYKLSIPLSSIDISHFSIKKENPSVIFQNNLNIYYKSYNVYLTTYFSNNADLRSYVRAIEESYYHKKGITFPEKDFVSYKKSIKNHPVISKEKIINGQKNYFIETDCNCECFVYFHVDF